MNPTIFQFLVSAHIKGSFKRREKKNLGRVNYRVTVEMLQVLSIFKEAKMKSLIKGFTNFSARSTTLI